MRFVAAALFVLSFVLALPLQGQIVTDRPSFVESSLTVPERSVQGEVGFAYSDLGSDASTWSTPALLRLWLASGAELRIATGGLSSFSGGDETETDLGNVLLGTKIHLADGVGGGPSTALLIHIDLPIGSRRFRGAGFSPSVSGVGEWGLSETLTLGVMPGFAYNRTSGDDYLSAFLGLVVGNAFTDRIGGYAEIGFAQLAAEEDGGNVGSFNLGATLLTAAQDSQVDFQVSLPVTDGAPDFAFTVGFSLLRTR